MIALRSARRFSSAACVLGLALVIVVMPTHAAAKTFDSLLDGGFRLFSLLPKNRPTSPAPLPDQFSGASKFSFDVVTRTEWGANPFLLSRRPLYQKLNKVVVHHTAWKNNPQDYAATVREIYAFHIKSRGWGDIGYNYLIAPNGVIYEGHRGGMSVIGVHTGENNAGAVGIAFMGDFEKELPTKAAISSFERLTAEIAAQQGIPLSWQKSVFGHRDFSGTDSVCPGDALYAALPSITKDIEVRRNSSELAPQRAAYEQGKTKVTTSDSLLELTFSSSDLTPAEIQATLPTESGIVELVSVSGNKATIRAESFNHYAGPVYQNTLDHLRWLVTYFELLPEVSQVEVVPAVQQIPTSPWQDAGTDLLPLTSIDFGGRYYQFTYRKQTGSSPLLLRWSADGQFDESTASEKWQPHPQGGEARNAPAAVVFQNTLVVARVDPKHKIHTSTLSAAGDWSKWQLTAGTTVGEVAMAALTAATPPRLFQAIKPVNSEILQLRSSEDGNFDASSPSEDWQPLPYRSMNAPHLVEFQGKLVLTFVRLFHRVQTVVSETGNFGTQPVQQSEVFVDPSSQVTQVVYDNKLYQSFVGVERDSVLTRTSSNAKNWSNWQYTKIKSVKTVSFAILQAKIYQLISKSDPGGSLQREL